MPVLHLVFVHGWSVTNLNTYGQLPVRLREECRNAGLPVDVQEIFLGRYISFHDEVRLADISRAFDTAVREQLGPVLKGGDRFVCITHSTGGPVIRDWWKRYFGSNPRSCPMSHLVMLAPANFGSALAKLGKGKISRLNSWFQGVQPGQGVLDWLSLGSADSWVLNEDWIKNAAATMSDNGIYPFVIIGQDIDRHFYDNLNTYTGELGSDGVVRSAAANLNATYISIQQAAGDGDANITVKQAPLVPFRIVRHKSHSGMEMGIMASVPESTAAKDETVDAIMRCIQVSNNDQYKALADAFAAETVVLQAEEKLEKEKELLLTTRYFIHDRFCMIVFRVRDTEGYAITDYDLLFTAGEQKSANHLPEGFFADRQQNGLHPETVTYFVNYDIMAGSDAVMDGDKMVRDKTAGIVSLGLNVVPRPDSGFVRYKPLLVEANAAFFSTVVKPNGTIMIDIILQRFVSKEVFRLQSLTGAMPGETAGEFKAVKPGDDMVV